MKRLATDFRGFVLLGVVYLCAIFIIIIIPLIAWSVSEYGYTVHSFKTLQALNLADAGADLAVWEIVHNNALFSGWLGEDPKTLYLDSFQDNSGEVVGDVSISVDILSPGNYLVTSTGFVPDESNPAARKTVKVKVFPHPLFNNAIFGNNSVTISGNTLVDSYNSSLGAYTPETAGANGDVGTNGALSILENGSIKGDVLVGPSGAISGNTPSNPSGEVFYSGNDVELEGTNLPDYFSSITSLGTLVVAGKTNETIPTGNWCYDAISVEAQSTLTISSNTHLYVISNFVIAGQATVITQEGVEIYVGGTGSFAGQGIVNATGVPSDLQIYGLGSGTDLSFTGQNDFYGVVYAPGSSVYMAGNADYFGAVVGEDVTLAGNIQFHYDESLSQDGPFSGYEIAYWQEN